MGMDRTCSPTYIARVVLDRTDVVGPNPHDNAHYWEKPKQQELSEDSDSEQNKKAATCLYTQWSPIRRKEQDNNDDMFKYHIV